uniref:Uncharacterized protein n=1 Tax=Amazona collaria TaxID=241587 RepID=A0A8B9IRG7_9PSIT
MDRTHSSIFVMSVSSSHSLPLQLLTGFTSRRIEDLAIRPGFLAFFSAYCRSLSSRTLAASWSSSSSSLPKRSMSLSSSSSAARSCGCPIRGSVQGQVGHRGLEPPAPVEGVPARGRGWSWRSFKFPSNPNHSMIL